MLNVFDFQNGVTLVAILCLLVMKAWAFLDSLLRSKEEYVAADKMTKPAWCIILGVSLASQILLPHPIGLLSLVGTVAAIVYLVDVRPAIRSLTRH